MGQSRGQLTSAASRLGSCRHNNSGTRLFSTSFRRGPRSPTRSPPRPRRTRVPRSPTAEARTGSRACVRGCSQGEPGGRRSQEGSCLGVQSGGRSGTWWGSLGRGACPDGVGPGAERQCSRRPAVAGGGAPVLCSEAAPVPAAAAGASSARPARRPRAAHRVHPAHPGERAAARSRAAPAEAGILGRRSHPGPVLPGPAPHLPSVQREVAEAKQA